MKKEKWLQIYAKMFLYLAILCYQTKTCENPKKEELEIYRDKRRQTIIQILYNTYKNEKLARKKCDAKNVQSIYNQIQFIYNLQLTYLQLPISIYTQFIYTHYLPNSIKLFHIYTKENPNTKTEKYTKNKKNENRNGNETF